MGTCCSVFGTAVIGACDLVIVLFLGYNSACCMRCAAQCYATGVGACRLLKLAGPQGSLIILVHVTAVFVTV
jgi:hypothetical protein